MAETFKGKTIKLTYPMHLMDDGITVCGEHLAAELIADALKLLTVVELNNADAAWKKLWELAAPVARELERDIKAGGHPGLLLRCKPDGSDPEATQPQPDSPPRLDEADKPKG
jgi:hypothetical protein